MSKTLEDHYAALDVSPTATQDEIKSAYRSLAIRLHPDRGGDADQFHKIGEAYSILSDPKKRAAYDLQKTNRPVENLKESAASVVDEYFRTIAATRS